MSLTNLNGLEGVQHTLVKLVLVDCILVKDTSVFEATIFSKLKQLEIYRSGGGQAVTDLSFKI